LAARIGGRSLCSTSQQALCAPNQRIHALAAVLLLLLLLLLLLVA
jgi:hypothetical protein